MKKIIELLFIVLVLCGCESRILIDDTTTPVEYVTKLQELGYSQAEAEVADKYQDSLKEKLLNEYDQNVKKLLIRNVDERIVDFYLNNNINIDVLIKIISDPYFIIDNLDLYNKYLKAFMSIRSLVEYVNTKAYKNDYTDYTYTKISNDTLMIASKIYYLDKYEPTDLVEVEKGYYLQSPPKLRKEASEAFVKMVDAARKDDIYFYISNAYRSYDTQEAIYNNYLKYDPQEEVDTYSSRPGFSDHQLGLTADLRTKDKTLEAFTNTKEDFWLRENAYKYGFILRYPKGKQGITKYIYESWHYRYVGLEAAKEIYNNDITFDEYYAYYVEQNKG